ncbi:MAG: hypothetical protein D6801_05385 [Alphaproteobacteria bacterium]|nr:MAG: hypothetical protein D6801_05385 [Alphaproteobacteria bacterium]
MTPELSKIWPSSSTTFSFWALSTVSLQVWEARGPPALVSPGREPRCCGSVRVRPSHPGKRRLPEEISFFPVSGRTYGLLHPPSRTYTKQRATNRTLNCFGSFKAKSRRWQPPGTPAGIYPRVTILRYSFCANPCDIATRAPAIHAERHQAEGQAMPEKERFMRLTPPTPLSRRGALSLLAGFGAAGLISCSPAGDAIAVHPEPDPLAAFRFPLGAGADVWSPHLGPSRNGPNTRWLALSSGGEDGAFGAGALVGWTEAGTRPRFDVVTGVSAGALIAPLAFLGAEWNGLLKQIFTEGEIRDLVKLDIAGIAFGPALFDTRQLDALIATHVTEAMIADVAREHAAGRRLLVVTTDLARARGMVWNMGALAEAGRVDLFRGVIRASASLPGLFPPVELSYEIGGKLYRETHIDGGVKMQILAVPPFALARPGRPFGVETFYLLVNNTLDPAPQVPGRQTVIISDQALSELVRTSTKTMVEAARVYGRTTGTRVFVADVPAELSADYDPMRRFDRQYMNKLFERGYQLGASGKLWSGGRG